MHQLVEQRLGEGDVVAVARIMQLTHKRNPVDLRVHRHYAMHTLDVYCALPQIGPVRIGWYQFQSSISYTIDQSNAAIGDRILHLKGWLYNNIPTSYRTF
jgi:hypothetical protein